MKYLKYIFGLMLISSLKSFSIVFDDFSVKNVPEKESVFIQSIRQDDKEIKVLRNGLTEKFYFKQDLGIFYDISFKRDKKNSTNFGDQFLIYSILEPWNIQNFNFIKLTFGSISKPFQMNLFLEDGGTSKGTLKTLIQVKPEESTYLINLKDQKSILGTKMFDYSNVKALTLGIYNSTNLKFNLKSIEFISRMRR